ncbi:delta-class carbonic anhydrase [Shewanella surugensis]|uniref:Cadmium carbonic anhydrase n=1 Tax=Shewanella surugensis TaxID=212020 RepID=A0ABT0LF01_9GAMM|nr:delta-class carbonic anhydrase [Shewanella surugensis]MCL1125736.1 cadmium carbonic anhydrase [Shewanella surugensis]
MRLIIKGLYLTTLLLGFVFLSQSMAAIDHDLICEGFGPQAPRNLQLGEGENTSVFGIAPPFTQMNLCNMHFHYNAEHKAKAFNIYAGKGDKNGVGGGFECKISKKLNYAESMPVPGNMCDGLIPGNTVEFHWVYSSCNVKPGVGLGACSTPTCVNPDLRVEAQVFTLVNDDGAPSFNQFTYDVENKSDYYQTKSLPLDTGQPIVFLGSVTGTDYDNQQCSNKQVTWSIRPLCEKLNIKSLGKWCQGNVFQEVKAHGVRMLVTDPALLSDID